ncbi:MAG: DUF2608 domain-containing protein [Rickettsiales bacterium]|nr:MAG: DUF2608 domain-containing protein [Rickettsiales bacterium]
MKYKILILLSVVLFSLNSYAEMYSANTIEEINNSILSSLEQRDAKKTLVIMPLKDFIIEPEDPAFYANDEKARIVIGKAIKKIKASTNSYLDELILTEYTHKFTDDYILTFINNLQKKNTPLIVVSRNLSGSFNKIEYLEAWTWKYLFDHDIDLSKSPIGLNQLIFDKQYKKIKGSYPTFYKGLLSCNSDSNENSPQSIIISLLFNSLKWVPDVVYVIDKDENYIYSLIEQFKSVKPDIQVHGYVYAPAKIENTKINITDLTNFWNKLVSKLNSVTRKETRKNNNPYE